MNNYSVANLKTELRKKLKDARIAQNSHHGAKDIAAASELSEKLDQRLRAICERLEVRKLAAYLSYGTEPETRSFLNWAQSNDILVLLPVSHPDGDLDWVTFDGETTEDGIHGFAEAVGETQQLESVDLIILPAMAVDKRGMRLGKGKGYYDRALSNLETSKRTVAVVFDSEILDELPSEPHDQAVWAVVSPNQTIIF